MDKKFVFIQLSIVDCNVRFIIYFEMQYGCKYGVGMTDHENELIHFSF